MTIKSCSIFYMSKSGILWMMKICLTEVLGAPGCMGQGCRAPWGQEGRGALEGRVEQVHHEGQVVHVDLPLDWLDPGGGNSAWINSDQGFKMSIQITQLHNCNYSRKPLYCIFSTKCCCLKGTQHRLMEYWFLMLNIFHQTYIEVQFFKPSSNLY